MGVWESWGQAVLRPRAYLWCFRWAHQSRGHFSADCAHLHGDAAYVASGTGTQHIPAGTKDYTAQEGCQALNANSAFSTPKEGKCAILQTCYKITLALEKVQAVPCQGNRKGEMAKDYFQLNITIA